MEMQPVKPSLEYWCRANIELAPAVIIGMTPLGERHIVPPSGRYVGDKLSGEVLPEGADCQLVRPDDTVLVDARYALRIPDGTLVYTHKDGRRSASIEVAMRLAGGEAVDPASYYCRLTPE